MRMIALPLLALGLVGCSLFQSNVKGGFSCRAAPGAGTCAPSTKIDDDAIHEIEAGKGAPGKTANPRTPVSSGGKAEATDRNRSALRVVYPAWRDGSGHVHKRTVAYVNIDAPGEVPPADETTMHSTGTDLLAIAESAPDLALVSPAPAAPDSAPQTAPANPVSAIQAQVRDILAKAPKPSAPQPAAPPAGGTTFPPKGD